MDYDTDRLDEAVLALLYLNIWEEDEWSRRRSQGVEGHAVGNYG